MWSARARLLLVVALVATRARAVPLLPIVLAGDATTLATGGTDGFATPGLDTLRLVRPALLAGEKHAHADLRLDSENTLDLQGNQLYSGSRADDLRTLATLVIPFRSVVLAASGAYEDGRLLARQSHEGVLLALTDRRSTGRLGVGWKATEWLRLGASAGAGNGLSYAVEAIAALGPIDVGFVRRTERLTWSIATPLGPKRPVQRPALDWNIDETRNSALATLALRTPWLDAFASWDLLQTDDLRIEGALKPWPFLALRAGWTTERLAFDDWALSANEPVARVNLGIRTSRLTLAADVRAGHHVFSLRHVSSDLATASAWDDNGAVTGERFFSIPEDFALYLRQIYRAQFEQVSVGWRWTGEIFEAGAGVQYLAAEHDAGGLVYGSSVTDAWSGHDSVTPASAQVLGFTGGFGVAWRRLHVRVSAGQLVPIPASQAATGHASTSPGTPSPPTKPPSPGAVVTPATSDGGRLLLLELSQAL